MAATINADTAVELVVLQHEFGFYTANEKDFSAFLKLLQKPFVLVFHTVLPSPDEPLLFFVQEISMLAASIIVITTVAAALTTNIGIFLLQWGGWI